MQKLLRRGPLLAVVALLLVAVATAAAATANRKAKSRSTAAVQENRKAKDRAPSKTIAGDDAPSMFTGGAMQHGEPTGHLPGSSANVELIGELEPTDEFGAIVPGQIADLAVGGGFAYLNSWNEPTCTKGGTYVVDIRDPSEPDGGRLHPRCAGQLPR